MTQKYVDTFYRVATRAFMYDKAGNEYSGEQLMLALLLHAKGESRNMDDEKYVARLLDDPNQKETKRKQARNGRRKTNSRPAKGAVPEPS